MQVIAVYVGDEKHPLEPIPMLLHRANQALQTLERYRSRLDEVTGALSALEVEDLVTVRDVVIVLQRTEMVRRIADELEHPSSSSASTAGSSSSSSKSSRSASTTTDGWLPSTTPMRAAATPSRSSAI